MRYGARVVVSSCRQEDWEEKLWVKIVCENWETFLGNKDAFLIHPGDTIHTEKIANGRESIFRRKNVMPSTMQCMGMD